MAKDQDTQHTSECIKRTKGRQSQRVFRVHFVLHVHGGVLLGKSNLWAPGRDVKRTPNGVRSLFVPKGVGSPPNTVAEKTPDPFLRQSRVYAGSLPVGNIG